MAKPLTQADLIFPIQSLSHSSTLSLLKRSALSIHNRLSSITRDSEFILSVSKAYRLSLVANERCGSWYIPPSHKASSAYFKSTDGHVNGWSFNLRRLNLHVLDLVSREGGCIIVDSTRRGKSMPDALSKTVPIWCCVLNRVLFPDAVEERGRLYTPPLAVSPSEHAQIEERVDGWVKQFLEICRPDVADLREKVKKPLRPIWVTQESTLPSEAPVFEEFLPVVLCTASKRVYGGEGSEGGYVQGAADDQEAWACGLTPKVFWENEDVLLGANEEELPGVIAELLEKDESVEATPILIRPTTNLFVSSSQNIALDRFNVIISCTPEPLTTSVPEHAKTKKYLHLPCSAGKLGSRDLRTQLVHLQPFFSSLQDELLDILVCCPTGKDLSVGVALAILCLYTDEDGKISKHLTGRKVDKMGIKQRLTWITTSSPLLNPSRTTLTSVNQYLMPDPTKAEKKVNASGPPPITRLTLITSSSSSSQAPVVSKGQEQSRVSNMPPPSLPAQIFAALDNSSKPWAFTRHLRSALPTHPSGTVTGTATFTPFTPSTSTYSAHSAYIYAEEGEFVTDVGLRFNARRKYIYFLQPSTSSSEEGEEQSGESIAVHFHEEDKKDGIGGLFVEMGDVTKGDYGGEMVAKNREQHLCGEDLYAASWRFGTGMLAGGGEDWWEVRYDVTGPKKDYVSETRYTKQ